METRRRIQGKSYGQKRPPLTHILQSILERYPDGGQILKEIIQNADDAGASKVAFLLDSRPGFYRKDSLYEAGLAPFQGPALYAQNNACFEDSDWENLEKLMRSSKKDDPLKVGRFGIGFNSVYHMTDLPSIVSGDSVAFLDPHETHFGRNETGQRFSLQEPLLKEYRDQFLPYEDVLDCKISTGCYSGTLFRFPLRGQPSELSKKNYTPDKVRSLFEALKKEASVILLFLKNIEEISLFETDESNIKRHEFTVRLSDSCRLEVRNKKNTLLSQVQSVNEGTMTTTQLSLSVNIEEFGTSAKVENRWLVYHQIDARDSRIKALSSELGLLPWVSFATPLNESKRQALKPTGGRIFCFLPLPPDSDAKTGFPVHIHGYFGLTDNRRGLKWPGLDCQNDSTADWNVLLLEKVGSEAYANMLVELVNKHSSEPGEKSAKAAMVYKSWPNPPQVEKNWKRMLQPMFSVLSPKHVFWTPGNGGRWVKLEEAHLDQLKSSYPSVSDSVRDVVLATLTQANEAVVSVPPHVMTAVQSMGMQTSGISPAFLRRLLKMKKKGSWNVTNMSRRDKLWLLEFALQDRNLNDMQGVPLLPLANGNFVEFRPLQYNMEPSAAVYVSSSTHPRSLFHQLDRKFLDDQEHSTALNYLSTTACDVQNSRHASPTQLVKLNTNIALNLLRQTLPPDWSQTPNLARWYPGRNGHPPESWLAALWTWIQAQVSDLSSFEGFPLIPHTSEGNQSIVKLKTSSVTIRQQWQGQTLHPMIVSLLGKIGCIVLPTLPSYVNHSALHRYIAAPTPEGVLSVLQALGAGTCFVMSSICSSEEKRQLRSFFSRLSSNLSSENQRLLLHLPIFEAANGSSFIAVKEKSTTRMVVPFGFQLPQGILVPNAAQVVSLKDTESFTLIQRLGIPVMNKATFLVSVVFSGIPSGFFNHQQVSTLMPWVLRQYHVFCNENSSFEMSLKQLPFVLLRSGRLATPGDVYDPQQQTLKDLFEGENDKFPSDAFSKDDILPILRRLGMKYSPSAEDIAKVARGLHNFNDAVASRKATALFAFFNNNTSFLTSQKALVKQLTDAKWVKRKTDRPKLYPQAMPFFEGKERFFKPSEVLSQSKANLVGASMPLVFKTCNSPLEDIFGWDKVPIQSVLTQLRLACNLPVTAVMRNEHHGFQTMVKQIYQEISRQPNIAAVTSVLKDASFPPWVWCGEAFAAPARVAFVSPLQLDLQPYCFVLPHDFQDNALGPFFRQCGVRDILDESELLNVLGMIKDNHERNPSDDLRLSLEILQWIVSDGKALPQELREKVLVPVITWDKSLKLVPCSECTFCDADWLKKGGSDLLITSEFSMIHETISPATAKLLGVPPISTRLTCAESLGIEQAGPHEPITTRLKNILSEYKEGAGVFRELIQNADDAGATEVMFVLDWRTHPSEKLLSSGMAECQGPALLVYNNSVFTDDDFKNITKLAGATKMEDLEKVGRFGLGFNSVYHFTDVPSFVSRNYAVFFDPHTSYLGAQLQNASRPGIKLDLEINPRPLSFFPDQFLPFNGLFGCDTISPKNPNSKFDFQGTLFRFPFRKKPGDISRKIYNERDIRCLLKSFQESSANLLLFTQTVRRVSLLEVETDDPDVKPPRMLFEVCKETVDVVHSNQQVLKKTFLQSCAAWTRKECDNHSAEDRGPPPQKTELVSVTYKSNSENGDLKCEDSVSWLINSSLGGGSSFQLAASDEGRAQGLLSSSGIAAKVSEDKDFNGLLNPMSVPGEAFCFLPLSIPTGLPVHVNGYFAVTSNRRGIWEKSTTDSDPLEVRWNISLMEDAVSEAYVQLLQDLRAMQKQGKTPSYQSFALWPEPRSLQSTAWKPLVKSIYQNIAFSDLPIILVGQTWFPVNQCIYQDAKLDDLPGSNQILLMFGYKVADLPSFAREGFQLAGCIEVIQERTMTQQKFLEEIFFPNIDKIPSGLRDPVVCFLIDECLRGHSYHQKDDLQTFYRTMLGNKRCIPCAPNNVDLAAPKSLINPNGTAADLFSPEDKRFPVGACYRTKERLLVLEQLGMVSDILDWNSVYERAMSVPLLLKTGEDHARKRVQCLVKYLNDHFDVIKAPSEVIKANIMTVKMFPVMPKPEEYTMSWKSSEDRNEGHILRSAEELYEAKYKFVAGASKPILDETTEHGCGELSHKTRTFFGFSSRTPTVREAWQQLEQAIASADHLCRVTDYVQKISHSVYGFLQELLSEPVNTEVVEKLRNSSWILAQEKFLPSSQLAFSWKGSGEPYLYEVPWTLANKYRALLEAAGVKKAFDSKDFIQALHNLKEEKHGEALTNLEFKVAKCFLEELLHAEEYIIEGENGELPLPDDRQVLHPAKELATNDAPWIRALEDTGYVHRDISIAFAYKLGATDIRSKKLARISRPVGKPFGQREELTDRLKGILKSYPCDVGILKELVQNADDAGATELHFIYDPRTHPTKHILSDRWEELQGPALCVYNNRPFSEEDLEGIQRLGIGSKTDDPTKTGQYGIGFNAVYHLTDCPSFISNGDTLCVLDPHCHYAPGADRGHPGRLIGPLKEEERQDYSDIFPGYLENFFDLTSATMFRFPLRNAKMSAQSQVSQEQVGNAKMISFMNRFSTEAKEILLFLNHVMKITLSKVEGNQLEEIYSVSARLTDEDTAQRVKLSDHIRKSKALETIDIDWFGITYPLSVNDTVREETWLIHQSIGLQAHDKSEGVPDGRGYGLLPRGGVAAKVSETAKISSLSPGIRRQEPKRKAFCFLPLPVNTGFPVHVNGHFFLDSARRDLWRDENNEGFGSKWNDFIMTKVLAQAYVAALLAARRFVPNSKKLKEELCFTKEYFLYNGMQWYHGLFPRLKDVTSNWKRLATALFQRIYNRNEKLLPLTKKITGEALNSFQVAQSEAGCKEVFQCFWLTPSEGVFSNLDSSESDSKLRKTLLRVGFQLLYSPHHLFEDFGKADAKVREITPDVVLQFLKEHPTNIGLLPCPIGKTAIGSVVEVLCLLIYCMRAPTFAADMFGTPLLLTEDNVLRLFQKNGSVFLSLFADLLPDMPYLFIHHAIATPLVRIETDLFKSEASAVLKRFDITALGSKLPSTAAGEWSETNNLIGWDQGKKEPSKEWLQRLWEFIFKENNKSPDASLDPICKWPILPTTSGMLAPISKGKVILDLTPSDSWSPNQEHIVALLRKLKCHEVDLRLISSNKRWDVSPILKKYLAYPNSTQDVLNVLDYLMTETDLSGILSEGEMVSILQFLQEDVASLKAQPSCSSTVRRLPFFKSFQGEFVRLDNVHSIFVVPKGLPTEESDVWMTGNNCVFLAPSPKLDRLYKELLGIDEKTHADCYINFIFPKFPSLKQVTRMSHLQYVRQSLLTPFSNKQNRSRILEALRHLAFIPDSSGRPQTASSFYDPEVKVFAVMLAREKKPPDPFDKKSGWLDLLREIGLKQEVSKDQFMTFANEVANEAMNARKSTASLVKKSKALVKHMLKTDSLHDATFLRNLSGIKFVATEKANDALVALHKQHLCSSRGGDDNPPFTHFKDAVPHTYERLTWTAASLLPSWAVPFPNLPNLEILKKPSLDQVINHVTSLSQTFSKHVDREQPEPKRRLLSEIMTEVYGFLQRLCVNSDSLDSCSQECITIGRRLSAISCILVEGGRVFVRCDQLAFELDKELPPYLYRVPRECGTFEHLFKRLGAVEKASPEQFAKLLSRLRESCQGQKMDANEIQVAKGAVFGLFSTLKCVRERDGDDTQQLSILTDVEVLYLPSRELKLQSSTDLVLFDCPQFKYRISDSIFDFLDDLKNYNLTDATPTQLVDLLPGHLKTKSLEVMVREELHPDCTEKKCRADVENKCQATGHLRLIMFSQQLLDGIERILKHQFQKAKLTADVRKNVRSFQNELKISCMETLVTELVISETNQPIPESKRTRHIDCFVGRTDGKKQIFIKHGVESNDVSRVLCKELYHLTGCYIDGPSWLHLQAILQCKSPDDISSTLDSAGVSQDVEAVGNERLEPELGSEIPQELHHLLVQYDDFYFRDGEFVAYEREESDDLDSKYVYARIIRKLKASTSTCKEKKAKKDRTKRKQKGESNLLSRYLIDIGSETIEVDGLDLYKLKRPGQMTEEDDEMEDEPASEQQDLVPYTASGTSTGATAGASSQRAAERPRPQSLEKALKEVKKALAEIWKLPEDKRRKAIKRLYLRWHPDKNMDMQDIATEVTKFILNEVERLKRLSSGGSTRDDSDCAGARPDFYDFNFPQWDEESRRQRSSYDNYRRQNPRFSGFPPSSSRRRYTAPDTRLSKLWIRQSREDLRSIKYLLTAKDDPLNCLVCFQCHQVAEKALKAALYGISGIADGQLASHDLVKLAYDLSRLPGTPDVTSLVAKLSDYYDSTRYPNQHVPPRAPVDVFQSSQQVQEAFRMATEVLNRIEQLLGM